MVGPPNYAKGVAVHNTTHEAVNFTVTYHDEANKKDYTVSQEVAANATHTFPEKTVDMGTWQAVAPVKSVEAGGKHVTPSVRGVVDTFTVKLSENGLQQQH